MSQSAVERRGRICELLKEGKPLSVAELSSMLSVSRMTIRRDLDFLEEAGKLHRRRGWAEPARTDEYEPSFIIRAKENPREKKEIGRAAAALVRDGDVIFVDVGTTLFEFARLVGQTKHVTVLTYWLPLALELAKYPDVRTIVLGGILRHAELSLVGSIVGETLAEFNADRAFLSVGGVSAEKGLTDYHLDEVEVKRAAVQAAREVVLLADHTKLGRVAPIRIAPLSAVDTLVTDSGIDDRQRETYQAGGLRVIVAPRVEDGSDRIDCGRYDYGKLLL